MLTADVSSEHVLGFSITYFFSMCSCMFMIGNIFIIFLIDTTKQKTCNNGGKKKQQKQKAKIKLNY